VLSVELLEAPPARGGCPSPRGTPAWSRPLGGEVERHGRRADRVNPVHQLLPAQVLVGRRLPVAAVAQRAPDLRHHEARPRVLHVRPGEYPLAKSRRQPSNPTSDFSQSVSSRCTRGLRWSMSGAAPNPSPVSRWPHPSEYSASGPQSRQSSGVPPSKRVLVLGAPVVDHDSQLNPCTAQTDRSTRQFEKYVCDQKTRDFARRRAMP
jgi:hypothetical protein